MWKLGLSILGPAFYSFLFLTLVLIQLSFTASGSDLTKNYLLLGLIVIFFFIHIPISGLRDDYAGYVKTFLPVILLRFLRQHWTDSRESISVMLEWATVLWALFAAITAVLQIRPAAGEGYYGFVHGNNDYVVMLFALFPLTTYWSNRLPLAAYYLALALTRSKGLVILSPMLILIPRSAKVRIGISAVAIGILFLTISYYIHYFLSNFGSKYEITPMSLLAFLSFGRLRYLLLLFDNMGEKAWYEHLIGSGFYGGLNYLGGKVGIEMDPFDTYNIYGLIGMVLSLWFYYGQVLTLKSQDWRTKAKFLPVIGYSIAGGHLFNNPMSNLVFVLVLFILEGRPAKPGNPLVSSHTTPNRPATAPSG